MGETVCSCKRKQSVETCSRIGNWGTAVLDSVVPRDHTRSVCVRTLSVTYRYVPFHELA